MPQITAVEPQRKNKTRFNIFIDGEFALALDAENLAKERIKVGQKISESLIKQLITLNEFVKVYDKVLRFLSYRPRSKKETDNYLRKNKIGAKVIDLVLEKLEKENYLNDFEFTKWWVANRLRFRPKGKNLLKTELAQKGIEKLIIAQVLGQLNSQHEEKMALSLAQKQLAKYKNQKNPEIHQKIISFLARRGFSWETIRSVVDIIFEKG